MKMPAVRDSASSLIRFETPPDQYGAHSSFLKKQPVSFSSEIKNVNNCQLSGQSRSTDFPFKIQHRAHSQKVEFCQI